MLALLSVDPWILAFSAITVIVTIWMGFRSAKTSKTASDFFVAGRSVSVGWNASAISGEYLSAASFMGIAGMVMSSGYDALWYPVCYACGYLFLLLFIAGPLRRFGAYTIPDFAEGRFDSPVFRKIAVVFVLFIGFFYTMPQMKGAGTTLAYIFPGLPYWAGVVLVGAVITLNVALGGMKGITLVQAFQYWAKMFAISVPIFVLMAVYGHYGKQVGVNGRVGQQASESAGENGNLARQPLPAKAPADSTWLNPFGPLTTKAAKNAAASIGKKESASASPNVRSIDGIRADHASEFRAYAVQISFPNTLDRVKAAVTSPRRNHGTNSLEVSSLMQHYAFGDVKWRAVLRDQPAVFFIHEPLGKKSLRWEAPDDLTDAQASESIARLLETNGIAIIRGETNAVVVIATNDAARLGFPPFGKGVSQSASDARSQFVGAPLTEFSIALRPGLSPDQRMTANLDAPTVAQAVAVYSELTGRKLKPATTPIAERVDDFLGRKLSQLKLVSRTAKPDSGVVEHADGAFTAREVKQSIESNLRTNGLVIVPLGADGFAVSAISATEPAPVGKSQSLLTSAATSSEKAWLAKNEKPYALLYTYSLIIAIVCGTAGLPHILVRFYTNPDGMAAKRTTMWVMILIGVFYVFPPVFGVLGRNLLPELYNGLGSKGTDKIVLELPRLLNEKYAPLGSILSGITCAGAFAAFMSTFSGLLVSMTGALAHDVYGRILRPKSTPEQRMRMFKIGAVLIGGVAVLLGSFVEPLEINFMVGQAFAIAAASYFPLLFMAVWWRKLTMKGAAVGMLTGGVCALVAAALTNFSNLASDKGPMGKIFAGFAPLNQFWAGHPMLRTLCEQPAIWAVPLAIVLMIVVSKLTAKTIPSDIRMKMLVLHAPEQLGLKQEYIQEHSAPPGH